MFGGNGSLNQLISNKNFSLPQKIGNRKKQCVLTPSINLSRGEDFFANPAVPARMND